jgi:hypothetical protein
LCGS